MVLTASGRHSPRRSVQLRTDGDSPGSPRRHSAHTQLTLSSLSARLRKAPLSTAQLHSALSSAVTVNRARLHLSSIPAPAIPVRLPSFSAFSSRLAPPNSLKTELIILTTLIPASRDSVHHTLHMRYRRISPHRSGPLSGPAAPSVTGPPLWSATLVHALVCHSGPQHWTAGAGSVSLGLTRPRSRRTLRAAVRWFYPAQRSSAGFSSAGRRRAVARWGERWRRVARGGGVGSSGAGMRPLSSVPGIRDSVSGRAPEQVRSSPHTQLYKPSGRDAAQRRHTVLNIRRQKVTGLKTAASKPAPCQGAYG